MDVVCFPDDPRPPRWMSRCWRWATSTACIAATQKIIERIRRGAAERGATAARPDLRSAPAAGGPARQGAAAADDPGAEARALEKAGVHGAAMVRFTQELSQWAPETFVQDGAGRLAARRPRCGWAPTSCSAATAPATSRCCGRSASSYGFRAEKIDPVRYKEFVVSSTRIRRLVGEGRVDEAGALLGHHYTIDGVVVKGAGRGREIGVPDGQPRTENDLVPPARGLRHGGRPSTARWPSMTNIGVRPTFEDGRGRRSKTTCWDWRENLTAAPCRWASCSGCATSAGSPMWMR